MKVILTAGKVLTGVWWLMGMESFFLATLDDPGLIRAMYEKVGASQLRVLDLVTREGSVGALVFADDIAYNTGLMVRPEHLREFFFPWLKASVTLCHSRGIPVIYHSDGDLRLALDDIVACGVDAIHPIEPTCMDIGWVKENYGARLGILGNIDLSYTLTRGTPEEVDAEVRQRIQQVGPVAGTSADLPIPSRNTCHSRISWP